MSHTSETSTPSRSKYPQYITNIPYGPHKTSQNTLDIFLPSDPAKRPRSAIWIVFIHGGAWRDPNQTSTEIIPMIRYLYGPDSISDKLDNPCPPAPSLPYPSQHRDPASSDGFDVCPHVAGFASINYRLSPGVQHPEHVRDVADALGYLSATYGVGGRFQFVVVGHSCGAALCAQFVAGIGLDQGRKNGRVLPVAMGLLAGIFDLRGFVDRHSSIPIYRTIIEGAFGKDEGLWKEASPLSAGLYSTRAWAEGRVVLVGWSKEDGLVEDEQSEDFVEKFVGEHWIRKDGAGSKGIAFLDGKRRDEGESNGRELVTWKMEGEHDGLWGDGRQLAWVIQELVIKAITMK